MIELKLTHPVYTLSGKELLSAGTFDSKEVRADLVKLLVSKNRANKPDFRKMQIYLEKRGNEPEGNM